MALHGRCLCEGVQFEIDAEPMAMGMCHCTRCQRRSGGAGVTGLLFPLGTVNFTDGEDLVSVFEMEDGATRRFCSKCGSPVFGVAEKFVIVHAGSLKEDPGMRPQFHMMVDYKAPWEEIHDDLPQFPEYPPMD